MNNAASETFSARAEREAMAWQATLSSDLLSNQQRRAFETWLAASDQHRAAWRDVNAFWLGLDTVSAADLGLAAPPAPAAAQERSRATALRRWPPVRRHRASLALAASLLLAVAALHLRASGYWADYQSAVGGQRQVQLADGSSVMLNTGSALSVDFSAKQRRVSLHRGEAFFQVAADPARPFVVDAGAGTVQALGTAFDVLRDDDRVRVTVVEHAVKISNADGKTLERLNEAEQIQFDSRVLGSAETVNPSRIAAWRQQRIVFQEQPLSAVVAELERYRPGKILIIDPAIKALPITGVFGVGDTDQALQAIEQSLPVRVRAFGSHLVLLSAR
ncbi:FecR family protein [Methylococcaceae bacterium WWC4]|nr:FecR family protein [Methylococcaceae bacterium WWC4]